MTTESAAYTLPCLRCGDPAPGGGSQTLDGLRLRWSVDTACAACGPIVACGTDDAPDELRARILAANGPSALVFTEGSLATARLMKVLREALPLTVTEAVIAVRELRAGSCLGTGPEVERLAEFVRRAGAVAARRPLSVR